MLNYIVTLTHTNPCALKSNFTSPPLPFSFPSPITPSLFSSTAPFSFDAHLQCSLPAMVDYALNVSKQNQLFYVGHFKAR